MTSQRKKFERLLCGADLRSACEAHCRLPHGNCGRYDAGAAGTIAAGTIAAGTIMKWS